MKKLFNLAKNPKFFVPAILVAITAAVVVAVKKNDAVEEFFEEVNPIAE